MAQKMNTKLNNMSLLHSVKYYIINFYSALFDFSFSFSPSSTGDPTQDCLHARPELSATNPVQNYLSLTAVMNMI